MSRRETNCATLDAGALERGAASLGVSLSAAQLDLFREYYLGLTEWNARMNLTTVTSWESVQERHFLESLTVAEAVSQEALDDGRFVDVGTGAGLPGIPLMIAFPHMRGTLVDSTAKKVGFLESMGERLGLSRMTAIHGRAETLAHRGDLREGFDLALARAVARMPILAELTLPFCRVGGQVVVHKTSRAESEIQSAVHAIETLGGRLGRTMTPSCDGADSGRVLVTVEKVSPTPARYPRRPGMPAKRPLMLG